MAKGVSIQVEGLDALRKKLGRLPDEVVKGVDGSLRTAGDDFVARAVSAVPIDQGFLKSQITNKRNGEMDYEVVSGADYSAYVEFGTRAKVQVPGDLQAYAAQFKGAGGGKDAKKKIYEWCRRQGIPKEAWGAIYIKLMTEGMKPQPFFFIQLPKAKADLKKDLQGVVKAALKK